MFLMSRPSALPLLASVVAKRKPVTRRHKSDCWCDSKAGGRFQGGVLQQTIWLILKCRNYCLKTEPDCYSMPWRKFSTVYRLLQYEVLTHRRVHVTDACTWRAMTAAFHRFHCWIPSCSLATGVLWWRVLTWLGAILTHIHLRVSAGCSLLSSPSLGNAFCPCLSSEMFLPPNMAHSEWWQWKSKRDKWLTRWVRMSVCLSLKPLLNRLLIYVHKYVHVEKKLVCCVLSFLSLLKIFHKYEIPVCVNTYSVFNYTFFFFFAKINSQKVVSQSHVSNSLGM